MKKYLIIVGWIILGLFIGLFIGYRAHDELCEVRSSYYFVKANEFYEKKDYRHAAEMLNRSIGSYPKEPDLAMLLLPDTYRNLGFDDLASEAEKSNETERNKNPK